MSIPVEIRKEEYQLGRIIPYDGAYGKGPFWGLDERKIKSWCPIEWAILGKTFLSKGIVPQEPSNIWDEICTSLHWDLLGPGKLQVTIVGILPNKRSQLALYCLVWGIHPVYCPATVGQERLKHVLPVAAQSTV